MQPFERVDTKNVYRLIIQNKMLKLQYSDGKVDTKWICLKKKTRKFEVDANGFCNVEG